MKKYGVGDLTFLWTTKVSEPSLFSQWAIDNPTLRTVGGEDPLSKTKKLWG